MKRELEGRKKGRLNLPEYRQAIFDYGKKIYFEEFFKFIHDELEKNFGEEETKNILRLIKSGIIKIENIESFFYNRDFPCDPALESMKGISSLLSFNKKIALECMSLLRKEVSSLKLCAYFFALGRIMRKMKSTRPPRGVNDLLLQNIIEPVVTVCTAERNPITLQVCGCKAFTEVKEMLGLNLAYKDYLYVIYNFLSAIEESKKLAPGVSMPKIEFLTGVEVDYMPNIRSYLSHTYGIGLRKVKEILGDKKDFSEFTSSLEAALDLMKFEGSSSMDSYEVFLKLKEIQEKEGLENFKNTKDYFIYVDTEIPRGLLGSADQYFLPPGHSARFIESPLCEIIVDCSKYYSFEAAEVAIGSAIKLCQLRYSLFERTCRTPKVIIKGSPDYTNKFVKKVEAFEKKITSTIRKPIKLAVCFHKDQALAPFGSTPPQYVRIISDMHVDHPANIGKGYYFNFGDDFVINCGDTSADALTTLDWVKGHMPTGLFVAGNHLGYGHPFGSDDKPKERYDNSLMGQIKYLANYAREGVDRTPVFLFNKPLEYNGVVFLGTPLYTNFELFGEKHKEECMGMAKAMINDYRCVKCQDSWGLRDWYKETRPLTPQDHINYFNMSYNFLVGELEKCKRRKKMVVIVTHFAPSYHCISAEYKNDALSAFFASNCSVLLEKYNIRLWCFGHVHSPVDYIHNKTRIVACPFGYGNENNADLPYNYGVRISFEDLKSNRSWDSIMKGKLPKIG